MPNHDYVEHLTASIVREYLSRKDFDLTFKAFEKEFPRSSSSINSRSALIKSINIERLLKKNQESSEPFRAIIEIIVNYLLQKSIKNKANCDKINDQSSKTIDKTLQEAKPKPQENRLDFENDKLKRRTMEAENDILSTKTDKMKTLNSDTERKKKPTAGLETFDAAPVRRSTRYETYRKLQLSESSTNEAESKNQDKDDLSEENQRGISNNLGKMEDLSIKSKLGNERVVKLRENVSKSASRPQKTERNDDLEVEELDDLETEGTASTTRDPPGSFIRNSTSTARPITYNEAKELRLLIFGNEATTFSYEWMKQGLSFNILNQKLNYGLVQYRGGPCGLLAAVQAYTLRYLLFDLKPKEESVKPKLASKEKASLVHAVAHILWKAGGKCRCFLTLPSAKVKFALGGKFKPDGLLEYLTVHEFSTFETLYHFIENHLSEFEGNKSGCLLVLYSAILSRGIQRLKEDMDDASNKLIGAHGYCSQEMVNLLLTGKASSNVFNDTIVLDDGIGKSILKGIYEQSEIGFLSLFEHYNSCEVGSNMKNPIYPIWVVCSESHFSVLFSRDMALAEKHLKVFDLYYFDGLAQQDDEIKLTINLCHPSSYSSDLIPPLDCCIRTKWKKASVDWNGSDPIL